MQRAALDSLKSIRNENKNKALLISATGTGKTFLSAFDVKNVNPKRMLFVVHRENIARTAMLSFEKIINNHSFGVFTGNNKDINADYIFSTIQTIHKKRIIVKCLIQMILIISLLMKFTVLELNSYQRVSKLFHP